MSIICMSCLLRQIPVVRQQASLLVSDVCITCVLHLHVAWRFTAVDKSLLCRELKQQSLAEWKAAKEHEEIQAAAQLAEQQQLEQQVDSL